MNKRANTIFLFLTILFFMTLTEQQLFARIIPCIPVCRAYAPNGSGVFYPAGCDSLTCSSCGNGMEYGYGLIYTFLDPLPCEGGCETSGGANCSSVTTMIYDMGANGWKLKLSGDIGTKFSVAVSSHPTSQSFSEPGEYENVGYLSSIRLVNIGEYEEGEVNFRYTVTAKDYTCNSECSCLFDTSAIAMSWRDCYCDWEEKPLFNVSGSIRVKENPRTDFDPFDIIFSPKDASKGLFNVTEMNYNGNDFPFSRTYNKGTWNTDTCECDDLEETRSWLIHGDPESAGVELPEGYEPQSTSTISTGAGGTTLHRFKVPSWQEDVWANRGGDIAYPYGGLPGYMTDEGWACDEQNVQLSLNLGSYGKILFYPDMSSGGNDLNPTFLPGKIEHCPYGQVPGEGQILWRFQYYEDMAGKSHLEYIYNGADPNLPEESPKYYKLNWNAAYDSVTQEYYNTTIDSDDPIRVWNASFDSQGRAVEYSSGGCSSGCGGSTFGYEKVEYYNQFAGYEDLVRRKYNANGDIVLENEYRVFQYGDSMPEYSIYFMNSSFELPDPNNSFSIAGIPPFWSATDDDPNLVSIFDPNDIQFAARYDTGEVIPDGDQILTLMGGSLKQTLTGSGIVGETTYFLEVDTGAYTEPNNSEVKITLNAYDPHDPNRASTELIVIDVNESSAPTGFGEQLDEGKWVTQGAFWDSSDYPEYSGWCFEILIEGNYVDVDKVVLSSVTFVGNQTRPLLVSQMANPVSPGEPNVVFVEWDYNTSSFTAIEKKWIDSTNARVTKYAYSDGSFSKVTSKTEYELLNENSNNPAGNSYVTYFLNDPNERHTIYPSGKRKDVEELFAGINQGRVANSYSLDTETGNKINIQEYTYSGSNVSTHTDSRGGVTEYTYTGDLLTNLKEPESNSQRQVTDYTYDGARRISSERRKDTDGAWVYTSYDYTSGLLDKVIVDADYDQYTGLKETTEYKYNDFGQVIREKGPDGTVRGKTYGLGGELSSEFILDDPGDIDEVWPDVVSQTIYFYDNDGHIEYIKKVKDTDAFTLCDPNNIPGSTELVTTKYEYDFLGRRTAVTEDFGGQALETTYEYNNPGEIVKTTLPNGKWTETTRDGRGLVKMQTVGHDDMDSDDWLVTLFYYDANGNLIERVAPDGVSTKYEYDNLDRLVKVNRGIRD